MDHGARALVLLSGGQDSAACLAWALARYGHVETIGFTYGQRHSVEMEARQRVREQIAHHFPDWGTRLGEDVVVDLAGYGALAESALTRDVAFEMGARGLPNTFVPGRNLVFLTVAGAHAGAVACRISSPACARLIIQAILTAARTRSRPRRRPCRWGLMRR